MTPWNTRHPAGADLSTTQRSMQLESGGNRNAIRLLDGRQSGVYQRRSLETFWRRREKTSADDGGARKLERATGIEPV